MKSSSKLMKLAYNTKEQSEHTDMLNCEQKIAKSKHELLLILLILREKIDTLNFLSCFTTELLYY